MWCKQMYKLVAPVKREHCISIYVYLNKGCTMSGKRDIWNKYVEQNDLQNLNVPYILNLFQNIKRNSGLWTELTGDITFLFGN